MKASEICRRMEEKRVVEFPEGCTLEKFKEILLCIWGSKRSGKVEEWMWVEMFEDLCAESNEKEE